MATYNIPTLPEVDQRCIKRGKCPWCLDPLYPLEDSDYCVDCEDSFVGTLTIED